MYFMLYNITFKEVVVLVKHLLVEFSWEKCAQYTLQELLTLGFSICKRRQNTG